MSYELKAILEYDAARLEIKEIKKPLADLFECCDHAPYMYKQLDNCIRLMHRYQLWERHSDNEHHSAYGMDEPEYRTPCEKCRKALAIFDDLKVARKRFGIAKVRLSRIARDHRNSTVLCVDEI
jgi:hypothetical protein